MNYASSFCICALMCALQLLGISETRAAGPSPSQVITALRLWKENGPKLQKALGHGGFKAARQGVPFMIGNDSDSTITYHVQTKSCNWREHTLKPGEIKEHQCQTTSGDTWFNIKFVDPVTGKTRLFSHDAGLPYYFIVDEGYTKFVTL